MKVLVVGSGGREHALVWKIAQSPKVGKIYCAPGNGGVSQHAQLVGIKADDLNGIVDFVKKEGVDLTVVGPEVPLVGGIVDLFSKEGLRVFGPSKELAELEGSKVFAKELMRRFGVPTADFEVFDSSSAAIDYLDKKGVPIVVKADGLCGGKGVIVCKNVDEAKGAVVKIMDDKIFGEAGNRVILEECLEGEEASVIGVSDGKNFVAFASSQDHKRAYDGDRGPNTGGMGAYSPAPVVTAEVFNRVLGEIISPVITGLSSEGRFYKGALYAGVMVTKNGPKVLEFNVRFGDPETQAVLPRLKSDIVDVMERSIDGKLAGMTLEWDERPCVTVVLVSGGYPGKYEKGMSISGVDDAEALEGVTVFHAGTKLGQRKTDGERHYITMGGRVLNVTALGPDIRGAIDRCYHALSMVHFDKMHFRKDIARRALERLIASS